MLPVPALSSAATPAPAAASAAAVAPPSGASSASLVALPLTVGVAATFPVPIEVTALALVSPPVIAAPVVVRIDSDYYLYACLKSRHMLNTCLNAHVLVAAET